MFPIRCGVCGFDLCDVCDRCTGMCEDDCTCDGIRMWANWDGGDEEDYEWITPE